jgi:hypothetical protein
MKRMRRLLLSALGGTAVTGAAAWFRSRPVPPVTVVVKNTTEKTIVSVRLEHERGVEVVENLARGASTTMRFKASGETSYRLRVRFADGSELAGGGGYAEAGYEFSETVGESAMKTDTRLPAGYESCGKRKHGCRSAAISLLFAIPGSSCLRNEPTRASKSRIKRLRGLSQPQYRLRVGEVRVFYDVTREAVEVLAIVTKDDAARWLAAHGTPSASGGSGGGQG